jgi:diadenosine tetraphosphate (Ap4A) HIT family hydrolase
MMFELDAKLAADTIQLARWPLSRVLLMNDANYPWLILVPEREGKRDIIDLDAADRARLMLEIGDASETLRRMFDPFKLNVAALGNQTAQLHIHVIARFREDPAWPRPVWGAVPGKPYDATTLTEFRRRYELKRPVSPPR